MPGPTPLAALLGFALGAPPRYHDRTHFLDMYDRILPDGFIEPLKDPGPGYEVYEAFASVGERVSLAVGRAENCFFILTAPVGAFTKVQVLLSRPRGDKAVTVKQGTVYSCSKSGRRFTQDDDVVFALGVLGPLPCQVTADMMDWRWNVPGELITARGEIIPGEIDTVQTLVEDPPFGDPDVEVYQHDAAMGGQDPVLDQHGLDRGIARAVGEDYETYRQRIRTLPDTVSPGAIRRALDAYLSTIGVGIPWDLIETWEPTYQTAYDVTADDAPWIDTNLFAYDDPRPAYPFKNRWLDENDYRGAFIVVVPNIGAIDDVGMAYDDDCMTADDCISPDTLGTRALSAYDVDGAEIIPQGFYDGYDAAKGAVYTKLFDILDNIKGGGVDVAVELRGQ